MYSAAKSNMQGVVSLWSWVLDKLPGSNSNNIPNELSYIILKSQIYGRARDLYKSVSDTATRSKYGQDAIVNVN